MRRDKLIEEGGVEIIKNGFCSGKIQMPSGNVWKERVDENGNPWYIGEIYNWNHVDMEEDKK